MTNVPLFDISRHGYVIIIPSAHYSYLPLECYVCIVWDACYILLECSTSRHDPWLIVSLFVWLSIMVEYYSCVAWLLMFLCFVIVHVLRRVVFLIICERVRDFLCIGHVWLDSCYVMFIVLCGYMMVFNENNLCIVTSWVCVHYFNVSDHVEYSLTFYLLAYVQMFICIMLRCSHFRAFS